MGIANPAINTGEAAGDTFDSVERLIGSSFSDRLNGSNGVNNTIDGGAGNDILKGYTGNDALYGGAGKDFFVFNTALNATTNVDTIADFLRWFLGNVPMSPVWICPLRLLISPMTSPR